MDTGTNFALRPLQPWHGPNRTKGELYLVPQDAVERAWREAKFAIQAPKRGIGRAYDIDRLHGRLTLGIDRLWFALFTRASKSIVDNVAGVVITSIGHAPKDRPTFFPRDKNSLTAHFVSGIYPEAWMGDAVEKIAAYGKEHGCKQLFALTRKGWFRFMHPFLDSFERVGLARDRMSARGRNMAIGQQRPGHFRLLLRDLPPGMSYDCARHRNQRIHIRPKGEAHGKLRYDDARPADAATNSSAAQ